MFKVVNGFPCTSGCDVSVARKGIDPRNPRNDPVKQEQLDSRDPVKAAEIRAGKAAETSGTAAGGSALLPPVEGALRTADPGAVGRVLDITV